MEYQDVVRDVLSRSDLKEFVVKNFRVSMTNLGFTEPLLSEFLDNIDNLDLDAFIARHKEELARVELGHFFDELVPPFFEKYILPEVPKGGKVLDLGCGRGTLIKLLVDRGINSEIVGLDIIEASEWEDISPDDARLCVVQEEDFVSFIEKEQPDAVVATWVFHHMEYEQQVRYLESLYKVLKGGSVIVLLEDAYADTIPPEMRQERHDALMQWSKEDRLKIMGAYDWIANRIFSMRTTMPVPFAYRTVEEWNEVLKKAGFAPIKDRYIGFPDNQDVHTPRSVIVASRALDNII
ncbi:class I SAM-dependent methyltransferase [Kordiimonas marina]|uniref:class I SAM-dependent methyltransferase n=1 Tax=Kordiimonas marina TaxID=2872312 RepID=UPI001FF24A54|nr:class I SAM-dependent methyltransferase [Kordiimonas marina]MCJ9430745.1 class I SAM-dependent methyltransferase [Kordiimonas marina]